MLLRIGPHHAIQQSQKIGVQLLVAVVFTAIPKRCLAALTEISDDSIHGGVVDFQHRRDLPSTAAIPIVDNNQVTDTHESLATITKPLQKPLLDEVTRSGQNKRHGNSSLGLVGPGVCREFPFFILSTSIGRYPDVQLNCARLFNVLFYYLTVDDPLRKVGNPWFWYRRSHFSDPLKRAGCDSYADWLPPNGYPAPINQPPRAEIAALKAVQAGLGFIYDDTANLSRAPHRQPLSPVQRNEIRDLEEIAMREVKKRLQSWRATNLKPPTTMTLPR